jgi:hypothetical protein
MRFKKAHESLYNDGGVETDKTYSTLVPSLACCWLPLLTRNQTDALTYNASLTHLTEEETNADVVQAYATEGHIMN